MNLLLRVDLWQKCDKKISTGNENHRRTGFIALIQRAIGQRQETTDTFVGTTDTELLV
jgi:hypothetical protein